MSDLICERCKVKDCECVPYDVECDSCIRAYKQGGADAINNFVVNAITEFQKFDKEHGHPALGDISDILCDVAEQLKKNIKGEAQNDNRGTKQKQTQGY